MELPDAHSGYSSNLPKPKIASSDALPVHPQSPSRPQFARLPYPLSLSCLRSQIGSVGTWLPALQLRLDGGSLLLQRGPMVSDPVSSSSLRRQASFDVHLLMAIRHRTGRSQFVRFITLGCRSSKEGRQRPHAFTVPLLCMAAGTSAFCSERNQCVLVRQQ